jgi:3-methyladenine DNA glycosylase AlkD
MMSHIIELRTILKQSINTCPTKQASFFKTGPGHYSEHDQFMGIKNPTLRLIARDFKHLSFDDLEQLLNSPFNEERLLALFIMVLQYEKSDGNLAEEIYQFYMSNLKHINNWNLVDASAHLILGAHIFPKEDKNILIQLTASDIMWERRVAIVATWYFIKQKQLDWTFKITGLLLNDRHDLIHKACGWMLREAGKKDMASLLKFLNEFATTMPRTMLRYAIERFPEEQRKSYLNFKNERILC